MEIFSRLLTPRLSRKPQESIYDYYFWEDSLITPGMRCDCTLIIARMCWIADLSLEFISDYCFWEDALITLGMRCDCTLIIARMCWIADLSLEAISDY